MLKGNIKIWKFLLVLFLLIFTASVVFAASKEIRDKILEIISQQVGKSYVYGTEGPNTFDCSGLVYYTYSQSGVRISRLSAAGYYGISGDVSIEELLPGDLIFQKNTSRLKKGITHVGIYIGSGEIIEAAGPGVGVIQSNLFDWINDKAHFVGARRVKAEYWPNNDNRYISESEKSLTQKIKEKAKKIVSLPEGLQGPRENFLSFV